MKMNLLLFYRFVHTWMLVESCSLFIRSFENDITWKFYIKSFILIFPLLLLYVITRKSKSIFLYFAVSAACMWIFWNISGNNWDRAALVVGGGILIISYFSEKIWSNGSWMVRPYYPGLLVFIAFYIFAVIYHRTFMSQILCVHTGIYWILCVLSENRRALIKIYEQNQKLHRFPKERIAVGNRFALGTVCTVIIIGMLVLPMTGVDRLLLWLWSICKQWMARALHGSEDIAYQQEYSTADEMPPFLMGEQGEIPPFFMILFQILETMAEIIAAAVFLSFVCYLIYKIYQKYHKTSFEDGDTVEFLDRGKGNGKKSFLKREKNILGFVKRTPGDVIRRHYRKIILEKSKEDPVRSSTPMQLEEAAGLQDSEERLQFHQLYEKARYGQEPCTQEESTAMKKLMK